MTTDAPRKAVFETPELLEHIISILPATVILTKVKRLSRAWKAAVDSSPAIRTKLWLQPQEQTVSRPASFSESHAAHAHYAMGPHPWPIYSSVVTINPLCLEPKHLGSMSLIDSGAFWLPHDLRGTSLQTSSIICSGPVKNKKKSGRLSIDFPHSWRDMYLTDPPITTGMLHLYYPDDTVSTLFASSVDAAIRDHSGITVGLLHDLCWASIPQDIRDNMISNGGHDSCRAFHAYFRFIGTSTLPI